MIKTIRTYKELSRLKSFNERFEYLKLEGVVGKSTFGYDRILNQILYRSSRWRKTRDSIIVRDNGCDLGHEDYEIHGRIIIHHINPITLEDIEEDNDDIYDPNFLITTSSLSHNAIHYSDESILPKPLIVRRKNDTIPWR